MIYLDNGATSFPKPRGMAAEMEDCILHYCGNPGRSGHFMSMKTGEKIYRARRAVAELLHIQNPERIIFTKNTTESLNLAMRGYLREGDHVVTTSMEHNSVLRPLKALESCGISHTIVKADGAGLVHAEDLAAAVRENTVMLVMTAASNVTGTRQPIFEAGRIAEKHGLIFLLDAAQWAGSLPLNVQESGISMIAFPGHKGLLGPLGTGGLYVAPGIEPAPLLFGGTGTESGSLMQPRDFPEGFEAGTVNAPAIIGLGYSVSVIQKIGIEAICCHERELIKMFDEAVSNMDFVTLYGPAADAKSGISLFNINGMDCEETAARLDREFGIAVRGGYHCAGLAHETIGTGAAGAVRLSVGPFNTRKDIRRAADAVYRLGKERRR